MWVRAADRWERGGIAAGWQIADGPAKSGVGRESLASVCTQEPLPTHWASCSPSARPREQPCNVAVA